MLSFAMNSISGGGHLNEQTLKTIFSGLLHDVGKMVYRAGENRDHASAGYAYLKERLKDAAWQDVLDGVRWHRSGPAPGECGGKQHGIYRLRGG